MESTQQAVIKKINEGAQALLAAQTLATSANALAQDIPAFQELGVIQKRLGELMQQISKLRGL